LKGIGRLTTILIRSEAWKSKLEEILTKFLKDFKEVKDLGISTWAKGLQT